MIFLANLNYDTNTLPYQGFLKRLRDHKVKSSKMKGKLLFELVENYLNFYCSSLSRTTLVLMYFSTHPDPSGFARRIKCLVIVRAEPTLSEAEGPRTALAPYF